MTAVQFQYQANTLSLGGEITLNTVDKLTYQTFLGYLKKYDIHSISLKEVNTADISCVALLIEARRVSNNNLIIKDIKPVILSLLNLYHLDSWLICKKDSVHE